MHHFQRLTWILVACVAACVCADQARAADLRVKAMTFNIRYSAADDGPNRWPQRREMVLRVIEQFAGDFVGVQEALPDQVEFLRRNLPQYSLIVRSRLPDADRGEAVPILYLRRRWQLDRRRQGTFWLSDTPEVPGSRSWGNSIPRIVTWGRFLEREAGRGVYVYNVHFDHASEPSRRRSAELLAERIASRARPDPVVVTGDFNAGERSFPIRYLKAIGHQPPVRLVDSFRVLRPGEGAVGTFGGFRGAKEGEKIDYVFTLPGARVIDAKIVHFNRDGRYPSDHYPVTAEMELPAPREKEKSE